MSFKNHLLPAWKIKDDEHQTANAAILDALDRELTAAETDTIESKMVTSLETTTGEWLDEYGRIFGILRNQGESDPNYRQRIIDYILLERGTIPAIKNAIRIFLDDPYCTIDVYEPVTNVFTLNKSRLNGVDGILGEYYTFGVIDIKINRPFPHDLIDVINLYKPAGVKLHMTSTSSSYTSEPDIVLLPPARVETSEFTALTIANGMVDRLSGHLNLSATTKYNTDTSGLLTLNSSRTNSDSVLAGSYAAAHKYYNLASLTQENFMFSDQTNMADVLGETTAVSPEFYTNTAAPDDLYASQTVDAAQTNFIHFTMDVSTYLSEDFANYLKIIDEDGSYDKSTYLSLAKSPKLGLKIGSTSSTGTYSVQLFNLSSGEWDTLSTDDLADIDTLLIGIDNLSDYLSTSGLFFSRVSIPVNPDETSYDIHIYFFEFGFTREIKSPRTGRTYTDTLSSNTIVTDISGQYNPDQLVNDQTLISDADSVSTMKNDTLGTNFPDE